MYDIKWKNDLKMYMDTFNSFVLEGNINDLQPIEDGEAFRYLPIDQTIAEMFSEKYCVVFFDHTKQSGKEIEEQQPETSASNNNGVSRFARTAQPEPAAQPAEAEPQREVDESWFNSFVFYRKKIVTGNGTIPSPNIELLKEYYSRRYLTDIKETDNKDMQGARLIDIRRMFDAIKDFEEKKKEEKYKDAKPFLFILPGVSRYMTVPGRPDEKENAILMFLFNITQLQNTNCKIVMLVDKMNDLPTWFESESSNSSIKKLLITMPDAKMREEFYRREMQESMEGEEKANPEKIKKFASYTESFSFRRLIQLMNFIEREDPHRPANVPSYKRLENIEKTVLKFNLGQSQDPWRDPALRPTIGGLMGAITDKIKGQNESVLQVTTALRSAVTGVNHSKANDKRPKAIFFFAGPTGTGKTELARQLTEKIFKKQDAMIRFDMSEFSQEHTDARLFGAPPGYVGYESGGELTKAIKQNPFSIVLFDEIEKASSKIWDKFLQILGDGRLTDGKGETVYFTHSVIIFTSNLGITVNLPNDATARRRIREELNEMNASIERLEEYIPSAPDPETRKAAVEELYAIYKDRAMRIEGLTCKIRDDDLFTEYYADLGAFDAGNAFNRFVSECVKERIKAYFDSIGRREVLGRIGEDNILVFNFISPECAEEIARNAINNFVKYLKVENDAHLDLEISKEASDYIIAEAKKPETLEFGGRGIETCVEKLINVPVGDFLFANTAEGTGAILKYTDGILVVMPR